MGATMGQRAQAVAGSNGRKLIIEAVGSGDSARLAEFERHGAHCVCQGGGRRPAAPTDGNGSRLAVSTPEGEIVAVAFVDPAEATREGRLTVAVHTGYQHNAVVGRLIEALAGQAREQGYRRLTTCVPRSPGDAMEWFREGGLHTLSSLSVGGVTEVVLGLE